jgi:hypothetical protein
MGEETKVQGFGGKAGMKETTRKTEAWMDGIRMVLRDTGWGVE